ncbi:Tuberous sclerosis 2-like protein, partial [Massospora cicadina]
MPPPTESTTPDDCRLALVRYAASLGFMELEGSTLNVVQQLIHQLPRFDLGAPGLLWQLVTEGLKFEPCSQAKGAIITLLNLLLEREEAHRVMFRAQVYSNLRRGALFDDDMPSAVGVLEVLTDGGRNLVGLERDFAPFLSTMLETCVRGGGRGAAGLLRLVAKIFKFNFTNLNSREIGGLLALLLRLKRTCHTDAELDAAQLEILDALVRYGFVHPPCLDSYLELTCELFGGPLARAQVWDVVHNLFRSHNAYPSLTILRGWVEEGRGSAMVLLATALWSKARVTSLSFPASAILESILVACRRGSAASDEALEALAILVESGIEMGYLEWELVIDVVGQAGLSCSPVHMLALAFDSYARQPFPGDTKRLMALLGDLLPLLTADQAAGLLDYLDAGNLSIPSNPGWRQLVDRAVARFCSRESVAFRPRLLAIISRTFSEASELYLDDLIERIIIPLMARVNEEPDRDLVYGVLSLVLEAIHLAPPPLRHSLLCRLTHCTPSEYLSTRELTPGFELDPCVAVLVGASFLWSAGEALQPGHLQLLLDQARSSPSATAKLIALHLLAGVRADTENIFVAYPRPTLASVRASLRGVLDGELVEGCLIPAPTNLDTALTDRLQDHAVASLPTLGRTAILRNRFQAKEYLQLVLDILDSEPSWQVVTCLLKALPTQLANLALFWDAEREINQLRHKLVLWITGATFLSQVRDWPSPLRRGDLYVAAYRLLGPLLGFRVNFSKQERDELVLAYQVGLHRWPATARVCIHFLTVCCFELPMSMTKLLPSTLVKLSQVMSAATIGAPILEFLSCLARLPKLYANFVDDDFKRVFGIALQYIQLHSRTGHLAHLQYILVLAYHVISVWLVNLKLADRRKFIPFIFRGLQLASGGEGSGEPTDACLDMVARYAFSTHHSRFAPDPLIQSSMAGPTQTWLRGDVLISVQAAPALKWLHVVVRRPSGTVHWLTEGYPTPDANVAQTLLRTWGIEAQRFLNAAAGVDTADPPALPPPPESAVKAQVRRMLERRGVRCSHHPTELRNVPTEVAAFDPGFLHLGLGSRGPPPLLPVPSDEATSRAIGVLDRMPVVDFHKVGVVYVDRGQTSEVDILRNRAGSAGYTRFIRGLGRLVRLRGCREVYTGGLDTEMDLDGSHTLAWGDGLSQLVFHVATLMPTAPANDPHCAAKKRHIGNDYVCVVYNDSGSPYRFDTLPGQFNLVNILVTPVPSKADPAQPQHCLIQAQVRQDLPELSPPLEPQLVAADHAAGVVRQLSLHAAIFAQVFLKAGSYATHWTERLRQIRRLHSRLHPLDG